MPQKQVFALTDFREESESGYYEHAKNFKVCIQRNAFKRYDIYGTNRVGSPKRTHRNLETLVEVIETLNAAGKNERRHY